MLCLSVLSRDDFKNIPPLDAKKLEVFRTVREITGVAYMYICVYTCHALHGIIQNLIYDHLLYERYLLRSDFLTKYNSDLI